MFDNALFAKLVAAGRPTGEVVAVNRTLLSIKGLEGVSVNSLVLLENGDKGLVRSIDDQLVTLLNLAPQEPPLGSLAVLEDAVYQTPVGPEFIGRVVNVLGRPLDGKGPIRAKAKGMVFAAAPSIIERVGLDTQLVTGVAVVDALFSFVLGQRIAVLGDSKAGKSTFLRQLSQSQLGTDRIMIHVLIGKKQTDIDILLEHLETTQTIKQSIVVVSSSFDSVALSYLAPYVACAMGEYFWKSGKHTIIMYDDLTNHAKVHRELSLLAQVNPGRNSYPGDIFYTHSSLLERAGKLAKGGGTQTAIPLIATPNGDITAYLPTNVMSITDGQVIFDLTLFRKGIRPAVNVGLSVSRVREKVQDAGWKVLSAAVLKKLADYRLAAEFSQFGSEGSLQLQTDLSLGEQLYQLFTQAAREVYPLPVQYLLLSALLSAAGKTPLDIARLKQAASRLPAKPPKAGELPAVVTTLLAKASLLRGSQS